MSDAFTITATDEELSGRKVIDLDQHGRSVMEQTGSYFELNIQTGDIDEIAVFAPRERDLTTKEVDALKEP